jgi:hypothetical protein
MMFTGMLEWNYATFMQKLDAKLRAAAAAGKKKKKDKEARRKLKELFTLVDPSQASRSITYDTIVQVRAHSFRPSPSSS